MAIISGTITIGNDTLLADQADDIIQPLAGDDIVYGGDGADLLYGGGMLVPDSSNTGDDTLLGGGGNDTLFGQDGNDSLNGESDDDWIYAGFGEDTLIGGSGQDYLYGDDGQDWLDGGSGDDTLDGGAQDDTLSGGLGEDSIIGGSGYDRLIEYTSGQQINLSGTELIIDGETDEHTDIEFIHIIGDATASNFDADSFSGDFSGEILFDAGAGNDTLTGSDLSGDTLLGGVGEDSLDGRDGNDDIRGEIGRDTLSGGLGLDTLHGGLGVDQVYAFGNVDFTLTSNTLDGLGQDQLVSIEEARLEGWYGNNTIDASAFRGQTTLSGGDADDTLLGSRTEADFLSGDDGNDLLQGQGGADVLEGGSGDDTLQGGAGDDTLNGGLFHDRVYENGDVDFTLTNTELVGLGTDQLIQIEEAKLIGGGSDNEIDGYDFDGSVEFLGRAGNDSLKGSNTGDDSLEGNKGDDTLRGGGGNDTLNGGTGQDHLIEIFSEDFTLTDSSLTTNTTVDSLNSIETAEIDVYGNQAYWLDAYQFSGNTTLNGGSGDDLLQGSWIGDDSLYGGTGEDSIYGYAGDDLLRGFFQDDVIYGGDDNDSLQGDLGNDSLYGDNDRDTLDGGDGSDYLEGGSGSDLLFGADGWDTLIGGDGSDTLYGGDELNPDSTVGTIDFLTGGGGVMIGYSDTFVLGDSSGVFYDDGNSLTSGLLDYAYITDFTNTGIRLDTLQLSGASSDYSVGVLGADVAIYLNDSPQAELIAVLPNVTSFNLNGSYVTYV